MRLKKALQNILLYFHLRQISRNFACLQCHLPMNSVCWAHRENQLLEAASRALASFWDSAKAAAVSALWNYFVSELASQPHKTFPKRMELSRQQRSVRKGFVRMIGANSEKKKPPASLLGLQTVLKVAASALWFSLWLQRRWWNADMWANKFHAERRGGRNHYV